jgi:16S rRNA (cytosine1402-N4)-methyltransferase
MSEFHRSVLLKEAIDNLEVEEGKRYIDATIGGGGHTEEILKLDGKVLGIDVDQEAIEHIRSNFQFSIFNFQLKLVRGNFRDIDKIVQEKGFGSVNGIIFDLGVSGRQLERAERGFSFQKEGPLDMRMDHDLQVKARDLVNILTKGELYELFTKLGEEGRAGEFSRRIVSARRVKPIETTRDLAEILEGGRGATSAFAKALADKKVFQALRIAVNDELNSLREALPKCLALLEKNGRILVISFHSLEDRIVKNLFLDFALRGEGIIITKKPIIPGMEEVSSNKRARSAKLRIFKKT